jgi:hypothetical protein
MTEMIIIKQWDVNSLEAKRFSRPGERITNVRVDHNSTVTAVTALNQTDFSVEFRFTANYTGMGFVRVEGKIVIADDTKKPEVIVRDWLATNNLPPDIANFIHNAVISNCIITATLIARDLQLPPPLPMPQVNIQGKPDSKGMEVA